MAASTPPAHDDLGTAESLEPLTEVASAGFPIHAIADVGLEEGEIAWYDPW